MKTRIISGAVGIALLALVLWLHQSPLYPLALAAIGGLAAYEMANAQKMKSESFFISVSAIYIFISIFLPRLGFISYFMSLFAMYILLTFAYIVICQTYALFRHKSLELTRYYTALAYIVLICSAMLSLSAIEFTGGKTAIPHVILTCMGAWVADSGAYFAGTFLGKHKLCPEISPKKTVEGLIGGAVANAVVFFLFAILKNRLYDSSSSPVIYAIVGIVCCFLGLLGDLTASLIKRDSGIKDYGNIMPGHGGAMDRFDSLIYIAPFMYFIFGGGL